MRRLLVISLISVHLMGNTEIGQLFKLPSLINHFFQHHQLNPNINFFEFIAMHYAGDDGTNADDDFDSQLPCHNLNHNTLTVAYFPMVKEIASIEFSSPKSKEYNARLQTGITSKHVLLILQPPRLA